MPPLILVVRQTRLSQRLQSTRLRAIPSSVIEHIHGCCVTMVIVILAFPPSFVFLSISAGLSFLDLLSKLFAISPPSSLAISARRRLLTTEHGFSIVMSLVDAKRSRCLISNQDLWALLPNPRVRTKTQEPCSFSLCSANLRSPFLSAATMSSLSAIHVPRSQTMTVPPPYCIFTIQRAIRLSLLLRQAFCHQRIIKIRA